MQKHTYTNNLLISSNQSPCSELSLKTRKTSWRNGGTKRTQTQLWNRIDSIRHTCIGLKDQRVREKTMFEAFVCMLQQAGGQHMECGPKKGRSHEGRGRARRGRGGYRGQNNEPNEPDQCWYCKDFGHWVCNCPKKKQKTPQTENNTCPSV